MLVLMAKCRQIILAILFYRRNQNYFKKKQKCALQLIYDQKVLNSILG